MSGSSGGILEDIFKAIVGFIIIAALGIAVVAGGGAVGGFALATALGAGKGLAIAAAVGGAIAAPFAVGGAWAGIKSWKKDRERKKWQSAVPSFTRSASSTPAPAPKPVEPAAAVSPDAEATPAIFVDALAKMRELNPDDRKKYLDRLRDAFPNEVETLHEYNDQMALAHQAKPMKTLTLVGKPPDPTP